MGIVRHTFCICGEETLWQALGLASENEMIATLELLVPIRPFCLRRQKQKSSVSRIPAQSFKRRPGAHITFIPVIHARAAQRLFLKRKPQRLDEMEAGACSEAEAGDVAGIRRNFRFDKHDMEHRSRLPHPHSMETTDQAGRGDQPLPHVEARETRIAAPTARGFRKDTCGLCQLPGSEALGQMHARKPESIRYARGGSAQETGF